MTGKSSKQKTAEKAEVNKKKQEETAKKIVDANQTVSLTLDKSRSHLRQMLDQEQSIAVCLFTFSCALPCRVPDLLLPIVFDCSRTRKWTPTPKASIRQKWRRVSRKPNRQRKITLAAALVCKICIKANVHTCTLQLFVFHNMREPQNKQITSLLSSVFPNLRHALCASLLHTMPCFWPPSLCLQPL